MCLFTVYRARRLIFLRSLALALAIGLTLSAAADNPTDPREASDFVKIGRFPLCFFRSDQQAGVSQSEVLLGVLDNKPATSPSPAAAPGGDVAEPRPMPKSRPRLLPNSASPTRQPVIVVVSPTAVETYAYLGKLCNRITADWDDAMRKESADWHPEIEVHFIFRVNAETGSIAIESQSSPSSSTAFQRFRTVLESLAPLAFPESLHALGGKEVRLKLDFKNSKPLTSESKTN